MTELLQRIHKPHDCELLLAIPVRREEFLEGLAEESNKDFAKAFRNQLSDIPNDKLWEDHYRKQAERILQAAHDVERLDCTVKESCTAADMTRALEQHSVVALVAHVVNPGLDEKLAPDFDPRSLLTETMVEFSDGLLPGEEFLELIPPTFHGILDLRTCNSVILGESLKSVRRDFLVIENVQRLFPVIQLLAFQHTIATLNVYERGYLQASQDARMELSIGT
jgi:hypothetical protein